MEKLGNWIDKGPGLGAILDANGVEIVRQDGVLYSNNVPLAQQLNAAYDDLAMAKDAKAAAVDAIMQTKTVEAIAASHKAAIAAAPDQAALDAIDITKGWPV